jgi:hypothetical protein
VAVDWWEAERELISWRRELDRLKRRARARLFRTLLLTGLVSLALVWMVGRKVPLAESRILIRVTEGSVIREDAPTSSADLADFLNDYAFSNRNLTRLIEKHQLYPFERTRGDIYALEELRGNLVLEVHRNQFLEARGYNSAARTVRISVTFRDEDPDVSFAVASDLAQLIIDSEARRRAETTRGLANVTDRAVNTAVARLQEIQQDIAQRQAALQEAQRKDDKEEIAAMKVAIARLTEDLQGHAKLVRNARENKMRADLRKALESGHLNMMFQIVDERPPAPPPAGKEIRLAMIGLACFLILLPLCAVAVGAFDSRIHDPEDVQRLGLEVVGHVPRFGGFGVGSMRSRRAAERRRTGFPMT